MEIIATGELRRYLKENLPKFDQPIIFISTDFIPGCPKCNSSATVYYIRMQEKSALPEGPTVIKVKNHKFPIDVYINHPLEKGPPRKVVIGTRESKGELRMILRRVLD